MGINVMARSQEDNNAIVTTTNSCPMISPMTDSARKNARKAAEVVRDALSNGMLNSFVELMAASNGFSPFSIFTMYGFRDDNGIVNQHSQAIINEASETWFNPILKFPLIKSVITITEGIRLATTIPVLKPEEQQHDHQNNYNTLHQVTDKIHDRFLNHYIL